MIRSVVCEMFDHLMISFGDCKLKSGKMSPIYINLRPLPSYPDLLEKVARLLLSKIHTEQFLGRRLAGLPMSGLPLAVAMGIIGKVPVLYPRQNEIRGRMNVEGFYQPGETIIAIDDVLTDGEIKRHQIGMIRRSNLDVRDLLVVVDREECNKLDEDRIRVHKLLTLREIVEILRSDAGLGDYEYTRTMRYLDEVH